MLDRAALKAVAKTNIQGNIGMYFLCSLLIGLISGAAASLIVGIILLPVLNFSYVLMTMKMVRNEKLEVGDAFSGFNFFGKALWLTILISFFTYLWSLLFVVPGIIKSYAYSMAPYILAENPNMTAREALNESKRITDGYKGDLFVLQLSFLGWDLLAGLTMGLLYIWLAPYKNATQGNYYLRLRDLHDTQLLQSNATSWDAENRMDNQTDADISQSGEQQEEPELPNDQQVTQPLTQSKKATMTCLTGEYTGAHFPVPAQEELLVGKDAQLCSIIVDKTHTAVSRRHMGVSYNPWKQNYVVTDYSENGTWANEQRLPKGMPVEIPSGTILTLADEQTRFLLD